MRRQTLIAFAVLLALLLAACSNGEHGVSTSRPDWAGLEIDSRLEGKELLNAYIDKVVDFLDHTFQQVAPSTPIRIIPDPRDFSRLCGDGFERDELIRVLPVEQEALPDVHDEIVELWSSFGYQMTESDSGAEKVDFLEHDNGLVFSVRSGGRYQELFVSGGTPCVTVD